MIDTRAQRKLLHTWITSVIVRKRLALIGRKDGPTEYLSEMLAAIRSEAHLEVGVVHVTVPLPRR